MEVRGLQLLSLIAKLHQQPTATEQEKPRRLSKIVALPIHSRPAVPMVRPVVEPTEARMADKCMVPVQRVMGVIRSPTLALTLSR